ncbi:Holliday junction branch migration protein RuvA [bacterium (Candidatus Gribaldobacteria) CG10_big_fil_rev_8_21_14_0_10_37_21]|uniref:Holliday junction branch migration complex subunit RuvA n=1 Tax=bacterium (Candidatus Gribaldobacteria) CG10_big_fil_rev_8_21_14_0_10_37_21 TaxID=2014275 RepID=A0A2H0UTH2_9BACT|nr:MAG: Holliday junction DNA helicase RuvA [Parcubacteria group bacterium CG1_02_37_13]PIR89972.1 MAG: Holliday junction branch migration protein RuvA [bacterium (Candidatus Gribaldobacteria) CG10_big_fil_rev_8_21_14_0_10_37_21]
MIAYLQGKIILKTKESAILEVNSVGYEVWLAEKSLEKVPEKGQDFNFYCQLEANERGVKLYGFLTHDQLELFKVIRGITGIGPKAALQISSLGSLEEIKKIIEEGKAIPGIGPKKASKIVLELSGKISQQNKSKVKKNEFENDETYLALIGLGFTKEQALSAIAQLPKEITSIQEKIKQALKALKQ